MKDSVIIVSGGMDSITLLYDKKDEIALGISFNYGSNHNERGSKPSFDTDFDDED